MDPNCSNLNLIKKLEIKTQHKISLKKIEGKKNKELEKNKFEFYIKTNKTNILLDDNLNIFINIFYIDNSLFIPTIYYLLKINNKILNFYEISIKKHQLNSLKSIVLKYLNLDNIIYKTHVVKSKKNIIAYVLIDNIDTFIHSENNLLVSISEIKNNTKIYNNFTVDHSVLDYFKEEGYYNLIKKNKKHSIIMLPKIEYYYSNTETIPFNKDTGYLELNKDKVGKYILRICLIFKERKIIKDIDEITDIDNTIYQLKNKVIIPSMRLCRLLSVKKNK